MNLEKNRISQGFSQAAETYDVFSPLQSQVGLELFDQLKKTGIESHHLLDMGCGTGRMTHVLAHYWPDNLITAIDCAPGMIEYAKHSYSSPNIHYLCVDIEDFYFPPEFYDVIWSNFSLQWCFNLNAVFDKVRNSLTSEGFFALSIPVETTLHELKTSWQAIDEYDHVNDFISPSLLSSVLKRSGFEIFSLVQEKKIQWYPDVRSIVRALRGVGVHNVNSARAPGLTSKRQWRALVDVYESYRVADKGLPMTYDVCQVVARKS